MIKPACQPPLARDARNSHQISQQSHVHCKPSDGEGVFGESFPVPAILQLTPGAVSESSNLPALVWGALSKSNASQRAFVRCPPGVDKAVGDKWLGERGQRTRGCGVARVERPAGRFWWTLDGETTFMMFCKACMPLARPAGPAGWATSAAAGGCEQKVDNHRRGDGDELIAANESSSEWLLVRSFEERRLERGLMMVVEERKIRGAGQPYIYGGTLKIWPKVPANLTTNCTATPAWSLKWALQVGSIVRVALEGVLLILAYAEKSPEL